MLMDIGSADLFHQLVGMAYATVIVRCSLRVTVLIC